MIYRDPATPRIAQLQALLDGEADLVAQFVTLRAMHDELAARVDALGLELAEEQGRWFKKPHVIGALQERYDRESVQLAQLVEEERALAAQLADVTAARTELAELAAKSSAIVATLDDPLGEDYRRIAEALRCEGTELAQQELLLLGAGQAEAAMLSVLERARAVELAGSMFRGVAEAVAEELFSTRDLTTQRARLAEMLPYAAQQLLRLVAFARSANVPIGTFDAAAAPVEAPVERSRLAREAPEVLEQVTAIAITAGRGATELRRRRAELERQQALLLAQFLAR